MRLLALAGTLTTLLVLGAPASARLGPTARTYVATGPTLTVLESGRVSELTVALPLGVAPTALVAPGGRALPLVAAGAGTACGGAAAVYTARTRLGMDAAGPWMLATPTAAQAPACWALTLTRPADVAARGEVRAELTRKPRINAPDANVRLTIFRGERVAYAAPLAGVCEQCLLGGVDDGSSLSLSDLDLDGVPETIVWFFTGGVHCCTVAAVFALGAAGAEVTVKNFGNPGAVIRTVRGRPLFASGDDRFAYAFTSYAGSSWPPRLWQWQAGRFVDVTRRHLDVVRRDAGRKWNLYLSARRRGYEVRGALAAWAGDECLLGRAPQARRTLLGLARAGRLADPLNPPETGAAWVPRLFEFLHRLGYA